MTEREQAIKDVLARQADRAFAAWITGSAYHRREADRLWAWAEFLRGETR